MYYVLSKDKKKGTKLSHRLIIDILSNLYPKSIIEKVYINGVKAFDRSIKQSNNQ